MAHGVYVAAQGAAVQARRMEVLSNNIANVDTVGFKPEVMLAQARQTEVAQRTSYSQASQGFSQFGSGVFVAGTPTSHAQAALNPTGRNLDFALKGEGFFVVQRDGEQLLTRAGNFNLNANGVLTTDRGEPVLDVGGGPITLNPNSPWTLSENGQIQQAGSAVELAIVQPQSLGDLVKVGNNMFRPLADVQQVAPEARMTAQGYLESSGMNPVSGMMEMISASRAFEANVHMIQNQDHIAGTLINRVLSNGNA